MKLVRKIKLKRAKEISLFKKIESNFKKSKDEDSKNPKSIQFYSDISKLHFFLILEYVNLINEKVDYNKIFPETPIGKNSIIDFNNLVKEQEKLKSYIQKSQNSGPSYFKNLGILNEVTGCYMIVTTHKHLKKVRNLNLKNIETNDFIFAKFDLKKLPFEFEKLCLNYNKNKFNSIERERGEFQEFLNLSNEEQDNIIDNMLNDIHFPFLKLENEQFDIPKVVSSTANTIQFAAERNINKIDNVEFLMSMLSSAEESENYELCVKIRDRIYNLS